MRKGRKKTTSECFVRRLLSRRSRPLSRKCITLAQVHKSADKRPDGVSREHAKCSFNVIGQPSRLSIGLYWTWRLRHSTAQLLRLMNMSVVAWRNANEARKIIKRLSFPEPLFPPEWFTNHRTSESHYLNTKNRAKISFLTSLSLLGRAHNWWLFSVFE